jgi:hypothetical protein
LTRSWQAAVEDVAHAEFVADPLGIYAFVGSGGTRRDDEAVLDPREIGGEIVSHGFREVFLLRFVAEVRQRKHDDREAVRRLLLARTEPPIRSAAAGQEKQQYDEDTERETQMPPGGHSAWSLAATLTPSPCRSVPSAIASPTPCSSIARVYQDAAQRSQTCKCPRVIQPDQSAVTDHIGVEHDDQLPPIRRPASRSEALVTDIA